MTVEAYCRICWETKTLKRVDGAPVCARCFRASMTKRGTIPDMSRLANAKRPKRAPADEGTP